MKRLTVLSVAVLATTAALDCGDAHAQARGPSAQEVLAEGQDVGSNYRPQTRRIWGWKDIPVGEPEPTPDDAALGPSGVLDDATRAAQIAELETWLRRLPGRFRIDGRVETPGEVTVEVIGARFNMEEKVIPVQLAGKVGGVADCASVGEGVGLHCIINASWSVIDLDVADIGSRPTIAEALNTLTPAMLDLGLNLDPPGIRSQLVTDDSVAHVWAGKLTGNTLMADRLTACRDSTVSPGDPLEHRCLQPLEIIAEPETGIVTIILRTRGPATPPWEVLPEIPLPRLTITLTMHRDPEAQPEQPMKTKKVR